MLCCCSYSNAQQTVTAYNPEETLYTGDIIPNDSSEAIGCYTTNQGWAGYSSPGGCPTINYQDHIVFSYVQNTIKYSVDIAQALNVALDEVGVNVNGYTYHWHYKNYNANNTTHNQMRNGPDPLNVTLVIRDKDNNVVHKKEFDYSQWFSHWHVEDGSVDFQDPFDANDLSTVELEATGQDNGFWAGYYGPELDHFVVRLKYSFKPLEETGPSLEEMAIFDSMCLNDPSYSMDCPGYMDDQLQKIQEITETKTEEDFTGASPIESFTSNESMGITEDFTGIEDPVKEIVEAKPEVVVEETIEEAIAEATPEVVVEETIAEATPEVVASDPVEKQSSGGASLNQNQLNALATANAATGSAENVAANAAGTSSTGVAGSMNSFSSDGVSGQGTSMDGSVSGDGSGQGTSMDGSVSGDGSGQGTSMDGSVSGDGSGYSSDGTSSQSALSIGLTGNEQGESGSSEIDSFTQENFSGVEFELASLETNEIIDRVINEVFQQVMNEVSESSEESITEENIEEQQKLEDELVAKAIEGDTSEEAQAALLGYNPNFRAYQQPQMTDGELYAPKDIYTETQNYDNPNARFFNGASDVKHREMVRQQYD